MPSNDVTHQRETDDPPLPPAVGTAFLFFGTGLLFLALAEETTGLPFSMPRFWYVHRFFWYVFAVASILGGCVVLRKGRRMETDWSPSRPGMRFDRVVLYTRAGCHLCDQAQETLLKYRAYLPQPEEIDVEGNPHLEEQFGTCLPVVEIDGKVRFRGRLEETLLRRLIEGTPPKQ